jgi:hypothetical protein
MDTAMHILGAMATDTDIPGMDGIPGTAITRTMDIINMGVSVPS